MAISRQSTVEVTIGLVCACVPTIHRLYQTNKRPQPPNKPPPWAFGIPTPRFLERSRARQRHHPWSTTISTLNPLSRTTPTLRAGVGPDEENHYMLSSDLKSIPSSQPTSSTLKSQPSNPEVQRAENTPNTMSVASLSPPLASPNQSHSQMRRLRITGSTPPCSVPARDRRALRSLDPASPTTVPNSPSSAASSDGIQTALGSELPLPQQPHTFERRRSTSGSLEARRTLSPPPVLKRSPGT